MIEELARIPVEVEYASEFRYRNPIVERRARCASSISQSGETADTLAAMREAKRRGARTLGIVNVVGSTIAREADGGIYLHAGPEIGVASTKAFTSQVIALAAVHAQARRACATCRSCSGREIIAGAATRSRSRSRRSSTARGEIEEIAEEFKRRDELPVPRPRLQLPGRARRRAQAEGNQLHPRRGLSGGRDEARADRADRREDAGGVHRAARLGVRQGRVEHAGGEGARRAGHRHHEPRRAGARRARSTTSSASPRRSTCSTPILAVDPAAAAGVLHRGEARLQRRPAAEPREVA